MMTPVLSICIPTYNRARFLKDCLSSVTSQVAMTNGDVEIVVSDNDSRDNTKEIVDEASCFCKIRYSKNTSNIGAARNVLKVVNDAVGDYCWVIGDDDIIKPGGASAILTALKMNQDLDYLYVNYSSHKPHEKGEQISLKKPINFNSVGNQCGVQGRVTDWSQLVEQDAYALTPIYASVFKRSEWLKIAAELEVMTDFHNVESTYPHTVIFSRMMPGKPAWQSGYPWVSMFVSQSSWSEYEPVVVLRRFIELLDLMENCGIDQVRLEKHRTRILSLAGGYVIDILRGKKYKMLEKSDIYDFIRRFWSNPDFTSSLINAAKSKSKTLLLRSLACK